MKSHTHLKLQIMESKKPENYQRKYVRAAKIQQIIVSNLFTKAISYVTQT